MHFKYANLVLATSLVLCLTIVHGVDHATSDDISIQTIPADICANHRDLLSDLAEIDRNRRCVSSCKNRANGNYQSCKSCKVYVQCSNGRTFDNRPCPAGLWFNDRKSRCDYRQFAKSTCPEPGVPVHGTIRVDLKKSYRAVGDTKYKVVDAFTGKKPNWRLRCSQALVYTVELPVCTRVVSIKFNYPQKPSDDDTIAFGIDDFKVAGSAADKQELDKSMISVSNSSIIVSKNATKSGAVITNTNFGTEFCVQINPGQPIQMTSTYMGNYQISGVSFFDKTPKLNIGLNYDPFFRSETGSDQCYLSVAWRC